MNVQNNPCERITNTHSHRAVCSKGQTLGMGLVPCSRERLIAVYSYSVCLASACLGEYLSGGSSHQRAEVRSSPSVLVLHLSTCVYKTQGGKWFLTQDKKKKKQKSHCEQTLNSLEEFLTVHEPFTIQSDMCLRFQIR